MINKIDKLKFQIPIFLLNSLILIFLIGYQFYKSEHKPEFTLFFYILLIFQFIITIILLIKNLITNRIIRAITYLLISTLLGAEIYLTFLFVGAISLGMGTSVGDDNLKNFTKSTDCKSLNIDSVKHKIENISQNKFSKEFDDEFIERIKVDNKDLPKKIKKINCGCRVTDSSEIVFRIWDNNGETYELEIKKENGKYKYRSLSPAIFSE